MKFLEFTPESEPLEVFEVFMRDFLPDILSALRNNRRLEIDHADPLSELEIATLYMHITKVLGLENNFCKTKYSCSAVSIRVEMRIRNRSFVWFRFVPLNKNKEPITKEKENFSLVLPNDSAEISALRDEGYNSILLFGKIFPPKK